MPSGDRTPTRLPQTNLYEVLQVSSSAGPEVVQAAYRVLARQYHPDVNSSPHAARLMRQLNAAYSILSDPERRARYDAHRVRRPRAAAPRTPVAASVAPSRGTQGRSMHATSPVVSSPRTFQRAAQVLLAVTVIVCMMAALLAAVWLVLDNLADWPML